MAKIKKCVSLSVPTLEAIDFIYEKLPIIKQREIEYIDVRSKNELIEKLIRSGAERLGMLQR